MTQEALLKNLLDDREQSPLAWREFLCQYSNLFLKIIWQFERDYDDVMERYLSVCSKLVANDFAVLRRYQQQSGDNPPQFAHWLAVVVRNICVDAHRAIHGRRRLPKAIAALGELERQIFKLHYWMGLSIEEIGAQIGGGKNGSVEIVANALSTIESVLTRIPQTETRAPKMVSNVEVVAPVDEEYPGELDLEAMTERWLAALPEQERLVVRLRFWEDLPARKIAQHLGIAPERKVYIIVEKALRTLRTIASREV